MNQPAPQHHLTTPETLSWLCARIGLDPSLSRYRLAKETAARLDWRDAKGRLQEMACRKQLLALERQGQIRLPPPRRRPPLARPPPSETVWPSFTGRLADLGAISLQPVAARTAASRAWNAMMDAHHPQGRGPLCGGQIRYLIVSERHGAIGGLAVSAAAWRLRAREARLGWTDAERAANLQGIVCNSRFLILPSVRVKHLASHVLGRLARQIASDWQARYGVVPWLMETYVEAARSGTAYRAANWIEVGMTTGRGRQNTTGKAELAAKRVFLYPLSRATLKRLCPQRATAPPSWVHREFGGAKLGDRRLQARLMQLATAFFAKPQANIPEACGSLAAAKAAYRFFDHEQVSMDALLEPHHNATIERMRRESVVLVAQDTSSLCYTPHPGMQGVGPISNRVDGPQGLMVHSALAFRPDGLPLGILDIECWAREPAEFGKKHACDTKPIEQKESYKWLRALAPIAAAAAQCPNSRVVTLADREADIYEYMLDAHSRGLGVVVRAKEPNRRLADEVQSLAMHMHLHPRAGELELSVPRRGRQPARTATLGLRHAALILKPPANKAHLPPIPVSVVLVREAAPPPGIGQPLEWMLLTSVAVASLTDAVERVRWYAARWGIEVFHRVLKSGCQIEERQLGTADRLQACLAIDAVVAWRIHHLTWLGRATPEVPCTAVFEDDQWQSVLVFKTRKPPPEQPPTLRQMIRAIAGLGGFLGRKSDGEPGTETLWRGLQRMDDIAAAFRSFRSAYPMAP
jgi:hypothetical protein